MLRVRQLRFGLIGVLMAAMLSRFPQYGYAQNQDFTRKFPQTKATVETALKDMQSATAGRLPVLEGFAAPADHPLDRYRRGYYQARFQVTPASSGGSVVHVSVEVTAWYSDPNGSRSGYQALPSNGRLETDLLDQLADQLANLERPTGEDTVAAVQPLSKPAPSTPIPSEPTVSAPVPRLPDNPGGFSSSLAQSRTDKEKSDSQTDPAKTFDKSESGLQSEADSLEEVLKNQAHPKNLVAVKKSGTPIVATASLTAKTLFLASAHDEFEMLDFNKDWVHVRISGLSRGWIWRNNLEMPDNVPENDLPTNPANAPAASDLYHVSREEKAPFPGDWAPLRNKRVTIVSVEDNHSSEGRPVSDPKFRLEFAKSVFDKDYADVSQNSQELAGIVVIFDAADGGMIAATLPALKQWKAGSISDAALWHACYFDPPETFGESNAPSSR